MGRQEDEVARVRLIRHFVEALERMHLAVPQRVLSLVVGFGQHQRQVLLAQDRRSENLVAGRDAPLRERQYLPLDHRQQPLGQFALLHLGNLQRNLSAFNGGQCLGAMAAGNAGDICSKRLAVEQNYTWPQSHRNFCFFNCRRL